MDRWRTAVRYRNRAELLRAVAEEIDQENGQTLRRVAAALDKRADTLEREAKAARA